MFAHGARLEGEQTQVAAAVTAEHVRAQEGGSASRVRVDREMHLVQEMCVVCAGPCARRQGVAGSQTAVSA